MLDSIIPLLLNIDQNLPVVVTEYGIWTYVILFIIIFFETGLVITPFLPGDSLLFVGGAAAAGGILDVWWLIIVVIAGAVLGDTLNYWIGNRVGLHLFLERFPNLVKKEYIDRTYGFYEKYGGATIFVARFVPMVRTFAPFLAGIGTMQYHRFLFYNVLGAVAWTLSLVLGGYYLGTFTVVKENMSLLMIGVVVLMVGTIIFIIASVISACLRKPAEEKKPDE
ncbi:MAG: VTT domain-containing protein [Methanoregula sp.]|jgi:membrane-associated protein|uniref:VTT domain-containing protein n=1 Tax=Methanoregula sp. TaxID=2052170 RepID=UPI0025D5B50D|nr:VTT domain-containing protein [Methanoregula sp.]MCK9631998.1 VTT domain-containing protein [Methanoregula sp.]